MDKVVDSGSTDAGSIPVRDAKANNIKFQLLLSSTPIYETIMECNVLFYLNIHGIN